MKIQVQGAAEHNLQGVDVEFGDGLTVVTGVSGSGKTSLVFDMLYHEARRRFIDVFASGSVSLRLRPAAVRAITGLGPAVAVSQNLLNRNPNSTLATASGLHPFLRLLYANYGSVRLQADADLAVDGVQHFAPYGVPFGEQGSFAAPFGFTGEQVDDNDLLYLRARQYEPGLGVFPSLDPVEGINRYAYVVGNPINYSDPTGLQAGEVGAAAVAACAATPPLCALIGLAILSVGAVYVISVNQIDLDLSLDIDLGIDISGPSVSSYIDQYNELIEGRYPPADVTIDSFYVPPQTDTQGGVVTDLIPSIQPQPYPPSQPDGEDEPIPIPVPTPDNPTPCPTDEPDDDEDECYDRRTGLSWNRTIFVPDETPLQLIARRSYLAFLDFDPAMPNFTAFPPFHAGQFGVNKANVECIASGMMNGLFTNTDPIQFEQLSHDYSNGISAGEWALANGHHRFLAAILVGYHLPTAPGGIAMQPTPWELVRWSE